MLTFPCPSRSHTNGNAQVKEPTVHQVIPYAIPTLKNKGYKLVALDTCLGSNGGTASLSLSLLIKTRAAPVG